MFIIPNTFDEEARKRHVEWDVGLISGPDGQDWRVPVSELSNRQDRLSKALAENGIKSAMIDDPVELYWLTGGRQNGIFLIGADGSDIENTHWVRRSLDRAKYEAGGSASPHQVSKQPRMSELEDSLRRCGITEKPAMLLGKVPMERWSFISNKISLMEGGINDCTQYCIP